MRAGARAWAWTGTWAWEDWRALVAIVRKDVRTVARYPFGMPNLVVVSPLVQFLLPSLLLGSAFLVGDRAVGLEASAGTDDLAGFLFTGALVSALVTGTFWGMSVLLTMERDLGMLEQNWLAPVHRSTLVLGAALSSVAVSLAGGVVLLGIGAGLFGARYFLAILYALPIILVAMVAMIGVAHFVAAAVLLLRQATVVIDATSFLLAILSGVSFPIAVLPGALHAVALALPTTYAVDALRHYGLGTPPLLPLPVEYGLTLAGALVLVVAGRWTFSRTERHLTTRGTLAHH